MSSCSDGDAKSDGLFDELLTEASQSRHSRSGTSSVNVRDGRSPSIDDSNSREEYSLLNSDAFASFISSGYGTHGRPSPVDSASDGSEGLYEDDLSEESDEESDETRLRRVGRDGDATDIIDSLQLDIPELAPILSPRRIRSTPAPALSQPALQRGKRPAAPPKMTDIGLALSRIVMNGDRSTRTDRTDREDFDEEENATEGDPLVDNYGRPRRRQRTGKRGRPKGSVRPATQFGRTSSTHSLPPNVSALMGQANVAYVQRQYPRAIDLYLDVVQRAPSSPEPYYSLGLVYEELQDVDRAASYFLISAHLSPRTDAETWRRIASLLVQVPARRDQAVYCLTRAIKASRVPDMTLYWMRAKLQLELGQYRSGIAGFGAGLRECLDTESAVEPFALVARLALRMSLAHVAASVFETVLRGAMERTLPLSWSHLNLLVELREVEEDHVGVVTAVEALAVAIHSGSTIQTATAWHLLRPDQQLERVLQSDAMPAELRLKHLLAQFHLRRSTDGDRLVHLLAQLHPPSAKLTLAVADALSNANNPSMALPLLLRLMDDPAQATPDLCVKVAQAYRRAGSMEMAIESLLAVLQVTPEHRQARAALFETYRSMGKADLALQMLPSVAVEETETTPTGTRDRYIDWPAVSDLFVRVIGVGLDLTDGQDGQDERERERDWRAPDETSDSDSDYSDTTQVSRKRRPLRFGPERLRRLRSSRLRRLPPLEYDATQQAVIRSHYDALVSSDSLASGLHLLRDFAANDLFFDAQRTERPVQYSLGALHGLRVDEWSRALQRTIQLHAAGSGDWDGILRVLKRLVQKSILLVSSASRNESMHWRLLQLLVAVRAEQWSVVLKTIRWFMSAHSAAPAVFLLSNLLLQRSFAFLSEYYHPTMFRFIIRLGHRMPNSAILFIAMGHQLLETQSYDEAARMYLRARLAQPDWPFVDLCLGNALLWRAFQRTCVNQPARLLHAFAFMLAYRSRAVNQTEAEYNVARALHIVGLPHLAVPFYQRASAHSDCSVAPLARYNLSRLYLQCGAPAMARQVMQAYHNEQRR